MPQSFSRTTLEALHLLGLSIRTARIERGMTAQELAERAGMSRVTLHRIERGDPGSAIGGVFEAAVIVGVPLFEVEPNRLAGHVARTKEKLMLLPRKVRGSTQVIDDEF